MELYGRAFIHDKMLPFYYNDNTIKLYHEGLQLSHDESKEQEYTLNSATGDENIIYARKLGQLSNEFTLMYIDPPVSFFGPNMFPNTSVHEVNWLVHPYRKNTKYSALVFRFDELKFFIPSNSVFTKKDDCYIFARNEIVNGAFDVEIDGVSCEVKLINRAHRVKAEVYKVEACSEIVVSFEPTEDLFFICKIYRNMKDVFSFICNRRNISFDSAKLLGVLEEEGKGYEAISRLMVNDEYKEPCEELREVSKTIPYKYLESHFGSLMQLIIKNTTDEEGTVSIRSIHPSYSKRNLIDLRQSLSITTAFEHFVRRYLPEISSEDTIQTYANIRKLIEENYPAKGKEKKTVKGIIKYLQPTISLSDKIKKVIDGYDGWRPMLSIVEDRFPDWKELAPISNEWRNELAHDKRKVSPDEKTIRSVRLVEHLNYSIVLREAGYTDAEIKEIIDRILIV